MSKSVDIENLDRQTVIEKAKETQVRCFVCKHEFTDPEIETAEFSLFTKGPLHNQPRLIFSCASCGNKVPTIIPKGLFK